MIDAHNDPNIGVEVPHKGLGRLLLPVKAIPKAEVPTVAGQLAERLRESTDSLTAQVMLKQAEVIIKSAQEQNMDHALLKMNGKELSVFGAKVTTRGIREYEYNDRKLHELEERAEVLKKEIAERKKFLQLIKSPTADADTGEIIEPAKRIRDGQTLAISFS